MSESVWIGDYYCVPRNEDIVKVVCMNQVWNTTASEHLKPFIILITNISIIVHFCVIIVLAVMQQLINWWCNFDASKPAHLVAHVINGQLHENIASYAWTLWQIIIQTRELPRSTHSVSKLTIGGPLNPDRDLNDKIKLILRLVLCLYV